VAPPVPSPTPPVEPEPAAAAPPLFIVRDPFHVAVSVSDLRRSEEWYRRMFGPRVIQESEESVLLGFGEKHAGVAVGCEAGTFSHFMFGIEQFDAASLEAGLREAGLEPQKDSDSASMSAIRIKHQAVYRILKPFSSIPLASLSP
jgi:hypothetical protein